MAATKLPFTTRLQTRDGSSTTKDARITNLLIEQVGEDEIHFIKRPGFSLFDGTAWSAAAALGSTTTPDGTMISFTGSPTGGANNATFHISYASSAYSKFDPSNKANITLSNSNRTAVNDGVGTWGVVAGIPLRTTLKRYCEFTITTKGGEPAVGLSDGSTSLAQSLGFDTHAYSYDGTANAVIHNNVSLGAAATYTSGDKISMLWDSAAGTLVFWKNGTPTGPTVTGITVGTGWAPSMSGQSSSASTITLNVGQSAWAYTPTSGYTGWTL